jgi:hypothetical protein
MIDVKNELIPAFTDYLSETTWLLKMDTVYANSYFSLLTEIDQLDLEELDAETRGVLLLEYMTRIENLKKFYFERAKNQAVWDTPKTYADNDLIHDENGILTDKSIELISTTIANKTNEKTLVSDTGKTVSFEEKWYQMLNNCGFKDVAVTKITDFISKFIEPNGWQKYFINNIGKNNKRLIQEYHVMDKYNLKHGTSYAAMHLSGDTTKCVLVDVTTATSDGRGEPNSMTFLEIGAHTIIDRFDVNSFKTHLRKSITEAGPDELAELFEVN